jgi:hypothetical protein
MPTFSNFCSPFLPRWGEREMVRFAARRTADDDPPSHLECPQATADRAFISLKGFHQLFMTTQNKPFGPLMIRSSPRQDTLVQSGQTLCGHGSPPHVPRQ